jgi:malonyl-CoA/methylmalonyl-CoA synthetase
VAHPDFGEGVIAVVVTREGIAADESTMLGALKSRIANFKVPKRMFFVKELPRNAMGKVQKVRLREMHAQAFEARAA